MVTCKMCMEEKERLIRCHIYPESMSKEISGTPHRLVSMSMRGKTPVSSYSPGGIYDDQIICASCEALFHQADDYAINFRKRVLKMDLPGKFLLGTTRFPTFNASADKLHKFAMQTWLRSHFSQRYENQQINDANMADIISRLILNEEEKITADIEIAFLFFTPEVGQVMMSPAYSQESEYPTYSFWMPNMEILISATQKGLHPAFSALRLQHGMPVTVLRSRKVSDSIFEFISGGVLPHLDKLQKMLDGSKK